MRPIRRSDWIRVLLPAVACLGLLAACDEGPTGPGSQAQPAGGRMWVAVALPRDLPDDRTWLPFLSAGKGTPSPALQRVQALQETAKKLRKRGDLEGSLRKEEEASRVAAASLTAPPPRAAVADALASLDRWTGRAEEAYERHPLQELSDGLGAVRQERDAAAAALTRGDTLAAVGHLAQAAAEARQHSPAAVALRVFARAEEVVKSGRLPKEEAARADRLLRYARDAVLTGDPDRAFRRAVYALQLVESYAAR
ncbi:MAG: hypothetical protein JO040_08710 [Gemmatimonadetes bacterium]|nr:hypothetical protein [Gemmatimonadota bacterium]